MALSRAVSEIFNVEKYRDLEITVKGKKQNEGATGPKKKFDDMFSGVAAMHQREGRTDGHRATAKTALTHSVTR